MPTTSYIIPNLPAISWGMKDITLAGALESATAVTSKPCSYQEILGITGVAFRTRWYLTGDERRWDGAAPIAEEREEVALFAGSGWNLHPGIVDVRQPVLSQMDLNRNVPVPASATPPKPNGEAVQFRRQIIESLKATLPVLCKDHKSLDMAVLYGYEVDTENNQDVVLFNDYWGMERRMPLAEMWPFFIFLTPGEGANPLAAAKQGLKQAINNGRREAVLANDLSLWGNHPAGAIYFYGDQAYRRWSADLESIDGVDAEQQGQLFHCNWWNVDCLFSARNAAQGYLKELSTHVDSETAKALLQAAAYCQEWCQNFHATISPGGHGIAFLGPWTGKTIAEWSDDVRNNEREQLAKWSEIDTRIVGELEAALATWPEL